MDVALKYDELGDAAQGAIREEFARRGLEPPLVEDVGVLESRKLVTVKRYRDLSEAIVARSILESANIPVFLFDENVVRLDWQISNMIGGIRVQVDDRDEAAATAILNEPVPESFTVDDGSEFEQPRCPVCHSVEITFQGSGRGPALLSTFMLGVPLPLGSATWLCNACGAKWEETEDEN